MKPTKTRTMLAVLMLAGSSLPALAQGTAAQPLPALAQNSHGRQVGHAITAQPDVSALRYYAQRGEPQNYQRELHRLRVFYPNWTAPASPDILLQSSDENDLWALYRSDDIDGIEKALRMRMAQQPGWKPSAELREKVANKTARLRLIAADDADRWSDVLSISRTLTNAGLSADIDLRWRVARAQALLDETSNAIGSYAHILADFKDAPLQSATLGKALEVMDVSPVAQILDRADEALDPAVRERFELEVTRQRLAAASSGVLVPGLTQADLLAFEAHVQADDDARTAATIAADAALLGWYYTAKSAPATAHNWFELARSHGKADLKTTEGLILALVSMEPDHQLTSGTAPRASALSLVQPLWDKNDDLGHRFIDLMSDDLYSEPPKIIDASLLRDVSTATSKLSSPVGAEALAWYAYNVRQYEAARIWFEKANGWEPGANRLFGQLLALLALGKDAEAEAMVARYGDSYPRLAAVLKEHKQSLMRTAKAGQSKPRPSRRARMNPIVAAHGRGDFATCLRLIDGLRQPGADVLQMKGWCLMQAKRPAEAAAAFQASRRLKGGKNSQDSAYGVALAALRSGHTEQALVAARHEGLNTEQRRTISVEALTQRARAAFNRRDYAAALYALNLRRQITQEPRDLSMLRGWSHYHLGRKAQARTIFASLNQHLSTRETRRALAQFR
ncbi:MAG: hypothetical protein AAF141_05520 [Pseudomonadota bacterium]